MAKSKVVWTPIAANSLQEVVDFVQTNWSQEVAGQFLDLVDDRIHQLSIAPELAPLLQGTEYRKLLVHKNVSMCYMLQHDFILILLFWDNRKDPTQLLKKLKDSLNF